MTQDATATTPIETGSLEKESTDVAAPAMTHVAEAGVQADEQPASRIRAIADVLIILVFVAVIGLPMIDMLFGIDPTPSSENRNLAPTPRAIAAFGDSDKSFPERLSEAKKHARDLPREVKAYTADHFGFRNFMIRQHGLFKLNVLGVSSTPHVLLGKRDHDVADDPAGQWLYYNRYRVVDHYRATHLFTDAELEQWRLVLEQRQRWLAKQGIRYLFVVAPNKHTIYPDYLPDEINRIGERSRTDQLVDYLRERSDVTVIDTRAMLFESRQTQPDLRLFHRTDTHWNEAGAFLAYEPIAAQLAAWFPAMTPLTFADFAMNHTREVGGDLAESLGVKDRFSELHLTLDPREPLQQRVQRSQYEDNRVNSQTGDSKQPRLLMFRDSFGAALMPFLAHHFSAASFIWTDQFETWAVQEHKPDVVITQMVERLLMRKPPELDAKLDTSLR